MNATTFLLALAVLLAPAVGAQSAAKTLGGGKAVGKPMAREELRQCLTRQDKLKAGRAGLTATQQGLDAEKPALLEAATALKTELASLDRTSAEAVAAYNGKAKSNDEKIEAWNQRNAALVEQAHAWQAENEAWTGQCAGRPYDENQELLIRAGK